MVSVGRRWGVGGLMIGAWVATSGAGPLRTEDVAAEARWVVHVDAERLHQGAVAQYLFSEVLSVEPHAGRLAAFQRISGLDLRKDIRSVTLYGKDAEDSSGVAVIRGDFSRAMLLDIVRLKDGYESFPYGTLAIHKWSEHGRNHYGCLVDAQTLVLGRSQESVQLALDVLRNTAPHLTLGSDLLTLLPVKEAVMVMASAKGLQNMPGMRPQAAILKNSQRAAVVISEQNQELSLDVIIEAQTADAAEQMAAVVRGMLAYGVLAQEQTPVLAKLAQSARTEVEGAVVRVTVGIPVGELIEAMRRAREQRHPGTATPSP